MHPSNHERQPLLGNNTDRPRSRRKVKVEFERDDKDNPKNWPKTKNWLQVAQITLIAFVCPMASSIIAPAQSEIQSDFGVDNKLIVLAAQSGFVAVVGIGPLFLAPMSETFGRRPIFLINLALFALLQIPIALSPNIITFVILRTLSGFCGSVGVANGGGNISDIFDTHERAQVLGIYLVAPLLSPTVGPMIGGLIVAHSHWRYIFWMLLATTSTAFLTCYFFLYESRAMTVLHHRKRALEKKAEKENSNVRYYIPGDDDDDEDDDENDNNSTKKKGSSSRSAVSGLLALLTKIRSNSTRAVKILVTQPIVLTMSCYQALVFSGMYSLYATYVTIWSDAPYFFSKEQIGFAYLGPALGFIVTSVFIVLYIDRLYKYLTRINNKNNDNNDNNNHRSGSGSGSEGKPEYRLPMANIGAVGLPISLFWFGWSVEQGAYWAVPLAATALFGASQVSIFNTVQTYYIDAYDGYAASALAAGAFLRSMAGGIIPLFVGGLFESVGYGWGMSVFGIIAVILMPAPLLFYFYGQRLRERCPFKG